MFIALLINLIFSTFITQSLVTGSIDNSQINPKPVAFEAGEKIAGAREVVAPIRINYHNRGVKLTAKSALVIDKASGKILFEKDKDLKLPIASISKLVTALVILDLGLDWDKIVNIENEDQVAGARIGVGTGESVRIKDLFYSSLISSANNATLALVRATGLDEKSFVVAMNKKAKELGMKNSYFAEPTGLNQVNHSTAADVAQLIKTILDDRKIQEALVLEYYDFQTVNTKRWIRVRNTDKLLGGFLNNGNGYKILGGKTGYTEEAGFCLGTGAQNQDEREIVIVVLGSESNEARFQEVKGLVWWTFENWRWG